MKPIPRLIIQSSSRSHKIFKVNLLNVHVPIEHDTLTQRHRIPVIYTAFDRLNVVYEFPKPIMF